MPRQTTHIADTVVTDNLIDYCNLETTVILVLATMQYNVQPACINFVAFAHFNVGLKLMKLNIHVYYNESTPI